MLLKTLLYPVTKSLGLSPAPENGCQKDVVQLGRVVPDANRCVQCGVCAYNCPMGIPVRDYAHRGLPVDDAGCITCGQCIQVCPRGTLRWETQAYGLIADRFPIAVNPVSPHNELNTPPPATNGV